MVDITGYLKLIDMGTAKSFKNLCKYVFIYILRNS